MIISAGTINNTNLLNVYAYCMTYMMMILDIILSVILFVCILMQLSPSGLISPANRPLPPDPTKKIRNTYINRQSCYSCQYSYCSHGFKNLWN